MPSDPQRRIDDLVALLAQSLGDEKALEIVTGAMRTLGTTRADRVLEHLGRLPGAVGLAARLARARGSRGGKEEAAPAAQPTSPTTVATPGSAIRPVEAISVREIAKLFESALGVEKSTEVVGVVIERLRVDRNQLDRVAALRVLEAIAAEPGLVGVTARFAKARVLFLFKPPTAQ